MMHHQSIVKIVNGAPIGSLSLALVQTLVARWKAVNSEQLPGAHLYIDMANSGYLHHGDSGGMDLTCWATIRPVIQTID